MEADFVLRQVSRQFRRHRLALLPGTRRLYRATAVPVLGTQYGSALVSTNRHARRWRGLPVGRNRKKLDSILYVATRPCNLTRVAVVTTPRSGTHFVVRMIARAAQVPWKVPFLSSPKELSERPNWVIGVHASWHDAEDLLAPLGARLVGLRRSVEGQQASLSRLGDQDLVRYLEISKSFPEAQTVSYDRLILDDHQEYRRLCALSGVHGIRRESRAEAYAAGPYEWCRRDSH